LRGPGQQARQSAQAHQRARREFRYVRWGKRDNIQRKIFNTGSI